MRQFAVLILLALSASLAGAVDLKGDRSGLLDYSGYDVYVQAPDTLRVIPYGTSNDLDSTGWLWVKARSIHVLGVVLGTGRGFGGGGGGGGGAFIAQGGDENPGSGAGVDADINGVAGEDASYTSGTPDAANGGSGGGGGGLGAAHGSDGMHVIGGDGGKGSGSFGGSGGAGGTASAGTEGRCGGYLAAGANGDFTMDFSTVIGSGGGGGGGGAATNTEGYPGGPGGREGGTGVHNAYRPTASGGGGGGGGGAGGARIVLDGVEDLVVSGTVAADGAGDANLGGGFGAGGGIGLRASHVNLLGSVIHTLGGNMTGHGVRRNGGTVKIFADVLAGDVPDENAGRVLRQITAGIAELPSPGIPGRLTVEPAVGRTSFRFTSGGVEEIRVLDVSGRCVRRLATAGAATLVWNGTDGRGTPLPAGVYFATAAGAAVRLTILRP